MSPLHPLRHFLSTIVHPLWPAQLFFCMLHIFPNLYSTPHALNLCGTSCTTSCTPFGTAHCMSSPSWNTICTGLCRGYEKTTWVRKVYGRDARWCIRSASLVREGVCKRQCVGFRKYVGVCGGAHEVPYGSGRVCGVSHVLGRVQRDEQELLLGYVRECGKCRRCTMAWGRHGEGQEGCSGVHKYLSKEMY